MKAFITGGAGFIGSNLADTLLKKGHQVIVYDNFITGQKEFVEHNLSNKNYTLIKADVLEKETLIKSMNGCNIVFHFQANSETDTKTQTSESNLEQNIVGTQNVLEGLRLNNIKKIVFASSATIYGEPDQLLTPEKFTPNQTSIYGASKFSAEALIEAYSERFDIKSYIFRFVSFVGPRSTHGIIIDFMKRIYSDPNNLEIGNGSERKSYLHVSDGIRAILTAIEKSNNKTNIFNLGNREWINVIDLADIIVSTMNIKNISYHFSNQNKEIKEENRFMHLDTEKISHLGWEPKYSVEDTIIDTVRYLMKNKPLLSYKETT